MGRLGADYQVAVQLLSRGVERLAKPGLRLTGPYSPGTDQDKINRDKHEASRT